MRSLLIKGSLAVPALAAGAITMAIMLSSSGPAGAATLHETGHAVTARIGTPLNAKLLAAKEQQQPAIFGSFKTVVAVETASVPDGAENGVAITCPAGYVATGGGGGIGANAKGQPEGTVGAYLTSSAPFTSSVEGNTPSGGTPNGWLSIVTNGSGATQTQFAWAVCTHM